MHGDTKRPATHPGQILAISGAYWRSFALQTAVKLDVFSIVASDALSGEEIARLVEGDVRGVTSLLNALVALNLLNKSEGRFSNTEAARQFLDSASPQYIGAMIRHHANLAEAWTKLEQAVRFGEPVRRRSSGSTGATQEDFLRGMHVQAMGVAPHAAKFIDLDGRRRLLDLGGGPGTWAAHFALQNESLEVVVFDLPGSQPFAEETLDRFGVSDRVSFHGGDYTVDELPRGFDAVLLSHILHGEDPDTCRTIVRKAVESLNEGGQILIHEFILEEDGTSPSFPALFSLNMLLLVPGGRSYTRHELEEMLEEAGVRESHMLDFVGLSESRILVGVV